jgi:hypothetical protein
MWLKVIYYVCWKTMLFIMRIEQWIKFMMSDIWSSLARLQARGTLITFSRGWLTSGWHCHQISGRVHVPISTPALNVGKPIIFFVTTERWEPRSITWTAVLELWASVTPAVIFSLDFNSLQTYMNFLVWNISNFLIWFRPKILK